MFYLLFTCVLILMISGGMLVSGKAWVIGVVLLSLGFILLVGMIIYYHRRRMARKRDALLDGAGDLAGMDCSDEKGMDCMGLECCDGKGLDCNCDCLPDCNCST